MKKTLMLVFSFALTLFFFTFTASAAEQMNFLHATGDLSGENWYWNHAERTLEVRSFQLEVAGDDAIVLPKNSRLYYSGQCSITSLGGSGISTQGLFVLNGTGKMDIAGAVYGIRSDEAVLFAEDITVEGRVAAASGLIEPDAGRGMTVSNGAEFEDVPYEKHKRVRTGLLYPVYVTVGYGGGASFYSGMFAPGQTVTITARPGYGYGLSKWQSVFVELENPEEETVRFTMPEKAVRVVGSFERVYSVTLEQVEGGEAKIVTPGSHFSSGKEVELYAAAENGYYFSHWETDYGRFRDALQPNTALIVPMVNAKLTPVFVKGEAYTLKVEVMTIPENAETVGGTTNVTVANFAENKSVLLRATPAEGYVFSGWMSSAGHFLSSGKAQTYFTMPGENATVTAVFSLQDEYKKTLTVKPLIGGTVNATGGLFVPGTVITLNAEAKTGYEFIGWSVEPSEYREYFLEGMGKETRFLMPEADVTISARFGLLDPEAVTFYLSVDQTEGGVVTSEGSGEYLPGYEVDLAATPADGYYFVGWKSAVGGKFVNASDPHTVFYMPANDTLVTAVFSKITDLENITPPEQNSTPLSGGDLQANIRKDYISFGVSLALCSAIAAGGTVYADVARKAEGLSSSRRRHRRTLKEPKAKRKL